ncbi:MAG TPA: class I SAM-dependent methyltransferase, partial [Candidatus Kapabacteria bacterium]|nr:class I SAM-dependent methyltransferase [Candidatus Kapabacteria bacterium]
AEQYAKKEPALELTYHTGNAEKIAHVPDRSVDVITIVLAIQNIEGVQRVFSECARVLKPDGSLVLVLNHPAFRVPKGSEWGWDEERGIQYRRVDTYLSEAKVKIEMHPGDDPSETTVSFHRSLQYYMKALSKYGFAITRLEEWISNRQGPKGRKYAASEKARKEIPLFLCLEAGMVKKT